MPADLNFSAARALSSANYRDPADHSPRMLRAVTADSQQAMLGRFAFVALWLFPFMAFTMPTEDTVTGWEILDVMKLFVLAFACFGGAWVLLNNLTHARFRQVADPLIPFFLFFVYAIITTAWSPLRSVTVFQAGSLVALLIYAMVVALWCSGPAEVSTLLRHLNLALIGFSGIVLAVYAWNPETSGLDRYLLHGGGGGIIHPTASGGTASLGILLTVLCHFIGRFDWARRLLVPSVITHSAVLFLSNSRTATGMALVTVVCVVFWYSDNRRRAFAFLVLAFAGVLVIVVDPGFQALGSTLGVGADYMSRGQSADQISRMSGRSEMWSVIGAEYRNAMMLGHGYFVTSEKGSILVWNVMQNHTAHNLILQVLVSCGAIGLVIFLYGLVQPLLCTMLLAKGTLFQRRLLGMIAVACAWFFGWSLLSVSFMGPIRPESLVFFTLLGIAVGQATQVAVSKPNVDLRP